MNTGESKTWDNVIRTLICAMVMVVGYLVTTEHRMTVVEGMTQAHDRALAALYGQINDLDKDIKALIAKH